ncbi:MAG: phosphatidylserine/phosphatidylglycerophosphate/cardiolipin synthase family protein [Myxococcota bacterium]|nr:phosphatidylserine/phosphatidylglycerophosphate/cardiolipin synthase family protein [Myxococcota bacterium]
MLRLDALKTNHARPIAKKTFTHPHAQNRLAAQQHIPAQRISPQGRAQKNALSPDRQNQIDTLAIELYEAMDGFGCRKKKVFRILDGLSAPESGALERSYNKHYGHERMLRAELRDELNKRGYARAISLLKTGPQKLTVSSKSAAAPGPDLLGTRETISADGHTLKRSASLSPERNVQPGSQGQALAPALGSPAFEAKLDQLTHSKSLPGNKIDLLRNGQEIFAARHKLIDEAKHSIHIQTFIIKSDKTGWDFAQRLAEKAQQGVSVKLIYDGLGSPKTNSKLFRYLRDNGVEVRRRSRFWLWDFGDRWHEKTMVVDGQKAIVGGSNIADEYFMGKSMKRSGTRSGRKAAWRDTDILVEGPSAREVQKAFVQNWCDVDGKFTPDQREHLYPPTATYAENINVRFVQHRPEEDKDDNTANLYLEAINAARTSIRIENAYFVPPEKLREALIDAARRGVDVQIMTNGISSTNHKAVSNAGRYYYDDLLAAGVKIYEWQGPTLHSKTATFDGQYALIGSMNLNGRSQVYDSESVIATRSLACAQELEEHFAQGLDKCREVSTSDLEEEGLFTNLKQRLFSFFRDML